MKRPPQDKGPGSAVPETAYQKHYHDIHVGAQASLPASTQRKIDICSEETGQCHVPALPEFHRRQRFVGRIKIKGQFQVEHPGNSHGHVTVTAEIKIQLEGVSQHDQKRVCGAEYLHLGIPPVYRPRKKLSQDDLLKQSHGQYHQSLCHIAGICLQAGWVLKLGNELSVQENGSHGYLGKIYGKQEIIPKTVISCLHAEGVNQPRNLLEGKKADPHRKEKPCKGNVLSQKRVQVLYKEIRVFKVKKQGQIGAYAKYQNHPPAALFTIRPAGRLTISFGCLLISFSCQHPGNSPVKYRASHQQSQIPWIRVSEKYQGHGSQKSSGPCMALHPAKPEISCQRSWEEH